jgi:hypothetical protein
MDILQNNLKREKVNQGNVDQLDVCNNIEVNLSGYNYDLKIDEDLIDEKERKLFNDKNNLHIAKFQSKDEFEKVLNASYPLLTDIIPFYHQILQLTNFILVFWCENNNTLNLDTLFNSYKNYFKKKNIKKLLQDNEDKNFNLNSLQYIWSDIPYYDIDIYQRSKNDQNYYNFVKEINEWNEIYHNKSLHVSLLSKDRDLNSEISNLEGFPYYYGVIEKNNCNCNLIIWSEKSYSEEKFNIIKNYYENINNKQNISINNQNEEAKNPEKLIAELYLKSYISSNKNFEDKKNNFIEEDQKLLLKNNFLEIEFEFELLKKSDICNIDKTINIETFEKFIKIYLNLKNLDDKFRITLLNSDNIYNNTYIYFITFVIDNLINNSTCNSFQIRENSEKKVVFFKESNLNDILNNINYFFQHHDYDLIITKNLKLISIRLLSQIKFILNKADIEKYRESFDTFKNNIKEYNNKLIENSIIDLDDYIYGNEFSQNSINIENWFLKITTNNIKTIEEKPFIVYLDNDIDFIKTNYNFGIERGTNILPKLCKNLIMYNDCQTIINNEKCTHLHPKNILNIDLQTRKSKWPIDKNSYSITLDDNCNNECQIYDNILSPLLKEKIDDYFIKNYPNLNCYYSHKSYINIERNIKSKKYNIEKKIDNSQLLENNKEIDNNQLIENNKEIDNNQLIENNKEIQSNNMTNIAKIKEYDKDINIDDYDSNVEICKTLYDKGFCNINNCKHFHPKKILLNVFEQEYTNFKKENKKTNFKKFLLIKKQAQLIEAVQICKLLKNIHLNK